MSNIWILFRAQFRNYFAVHRGTGTNGAKTAMSKQKIGAYFGMGILIVYAVFNNIAVAFGMEISGYGYVVYPYTVTSAALAIIFLGIFQIQGSLFANKQQHMLASLPLAHWQILGSRFAFLYCIYFAIALLLILPGSIVWLIMSGSGVATWLFLIGMLPMNPLLPMIIAALLSIFVYYLVSFFPYKEILAAIVLAIFVLTLIIAPLFMMDMTVDLTDITQLIIDNIRMYPPSKWLLEFTENAHFFSAILFIAVSLLTSILGIYGISKKYQDIELLFVRRQKHTTSAVITGKKRKILHTLVMQELRKFFGSSVLMLNIGFGMVMLLVLAGIILVIPITTLTDFFQPFDIMLYVRFIPYVLCTFIILVYYSAASISLEGNTLWIKQTTPINKTLFVQSKILANILLIALPVLITNLVILLKIKLAAADMLMLFLLPTSYAIVVSVLGVFCNDAFPKFNWSSEAEVVKQGMAVLLTMFGMMFLLAIPLVIVATLRPFPYYLVSSIFALLQLIGAYGLYRLLIRKQVIQYD